MKTTSLSTLGDLNREDLEGILVQALAALSVLPGYTDKEPDTILNSCYENHQVIVAGEAPGPVSGVFSGPSE